MSNIIYINEYKKIISYILSDYNNTEQTSMVNLDSLVNETNIDILRAVNIIIESNTPMQFKNLFTCTKKNKTTYFTNCNISEIKSDDNQSLKTELQKLFIKHRLPSLFYSNKSNVPIGHEDSYHISKLEDVYFYDCLNMKEDMARSINFPNIMCSLNIRLHIPYFILNKIESLGIKPIYKRPFVYKNSIYSENFINNKVPNDKTILDNNLYRDYRDSRLLSMNTIYEVVINVTLNELKAIVNACYPLERDVNKPVICYMYYMLVNYSKIYESIKIDNDRDLMNILWRK